MVSCGGGYISGPKGIWIPQSTIRSPCTIAAIKTCGNGDALCLEEGKEPDEPEEEEDNDSITEGTLLD
jgi:hypothetical protein